jgi:hypothetical protein
VGLHRGSDGSEPLRPEGAGRPAGVHEVRKAARTRVLGAGTLACPACDAPVAPAPGASAPTDGLECPFCSHAGAVRDFLSLASPARPARVEVRVIAP